MQRTRGLVFAWVGLVATAVGCQQGPEPVGRDEEAVISDGVHSSGNRRLLFLPPMVAQPIVQGAPDPGANPVLRIDEIDPASGDRVAPIARFTMHTGPGSETIRYDAAAGAYVVNWHTDAFALDPARTYRIAVRVDDEVLGYADVDVVASGRELKNVDTSEYIPLLDDRTLPIKFRIATDRDHDRIADFMDDCPDVANRDQVDSDGDGAGDACEARVVRHRLTGETLLADGGAAELALALAARPGEAIALAIDWGDGESTLRADVGDHARLALAHAYGAAGRFAVAATVCAPTGGCNDVALGAVAVLADKADAPAVAFGDGGPADQQLAEALAVNALGELGARHGIDAFGDLGGARTECTPDSQCHDKVQQSQGGVPVLGGQAIVHFNHDGSLQTVTDDLVTLPPVDTTATLAAADAIAIATAQLPGCDDCLTRAPTAELMILPAGDAAYLVWAVQLDREDGSAHTSMLRVFVDAHTGAIRLSFDNLQAGATTVSGVSNYYGVPSLNGFNASGQFYLEDTARKLGTFTFKNTTSSVYRSADADGIYDAADQRSMIDAAYGAAKVYDYFKNVHGRNGLDGSGGPAYYTSIDGVTGLLSSAVHYSTHYNNAFWNGQYMTYGDGDGTTFTSLTALDICGHEMTHGITERTAGLVYSGESGALNESMSDIFGELTEAYALGESADTWKVGEKAYTPGTAGDALRYLDTPHLGGQPDHYSERYTGTSDNGGVHTNSGIGNNAFYLLAKGGHHHLGGTVLGIGTDAAARIWFKALTSYMTASTSFAGARTATLNAAAALYGATSQQYKSTCDAWSAVGVGTACSTGTSSPPPPPPGSELVTNGGFEGSVSPWVLSGSGAFYVNPGNYPKGGTGYIYFGNVNSAIGQAYQQLSIPSGTAPVLYFSLNVTSAETTTTTQYDKLYVEVRNTAGTLLATLATYSNLNKTSAGVYSAKSVSLAAYAGQTIRVQFRATTDASYVTTFRVDSVSTVSSTANGFGTLEPPAVECGGEGQPPCDCTDASCESCGALDTVDNCGACGNVCGAGANQTASCTAGLCDAACNAGYGDCDGDPANGCETATSDDPYSCGACGTVCQDATGALGTCSAGTCVSACDGTHDDCDGDPANGCETLLTTPTDCGQCGNICRLPFALPTCSDGACEIAGCIAGHSDCDGNPANGCEVGGACPTASCPTALVVEPLARWYQSAPGVPLASAGTVRALLTFQRAAGMTFPEVPLQVWSVPSITEPPYSVSIQLDPSGATFALAVSIDLRALPATDTTLAFRPVSNEQGTMSPAQAPLLAASFACAGGQ